MTSLETIKSIGYILVLILVFSPLTFLIANTFVDGVNDNCYEKYPYLVKEDVSLENETYQNNQRLACQEEYQLNLEKEKTTIFVIVSIVSIITLFLLLSLKGITPVIMYGLFFGVSINIIRLVWGFDEANSFIAVGLGIVLFVMALIFINKNLVLENNQTKKKK